MVEFQPPMPTRLSWELDNEKILESIDLAYKDAQLIINVRLSQLLKKRVFFVNFNFFFVPKDIDLRIFVHEAYGKGLMKKCRLSPDAFIQMALQLAYYRDAGKFSLTYEASMTRLFREGRTETVRPCTIESAAWVKAMENPNSNVSFFSLKILKYCLPSNIGASVQHISVETLRAS